MSEQATEPKGLAAAVAQEIVDDLFTDGAGRKYERLVLAHPGSDSVAVRHSTGWGEAAARDRIAARILRLLMEGR